MSKNQEVFMSRIKQDMKGQYVASVFVSNNETKYIYDRRRNLFFIEEQGNIREQVTEQQFFTYLGIDLKIEITKVA